MVESDEFMDETDEKSLYFSYIQEKQDNLLEKLHQNSQELSQIHPGVSALDDARRLVANIADYKDVDECGRQFGPNTGGCLNGLHIVYMILST